MSELVPCLPFPRDELRRHVREQLASFAPPLRLIAEDVLTDCATIDLVAVDPDGRCAALLLAADGECREALTRSLGQRSWLTRHARDWAKLAPGLELRPDASAVAILLCPRLHPETIAAAESLGPQVIRLERLRCMRAGTRNVVLIDPIDERERPRPGAGRGASESASSFRSGLSDDDFGLTPEELREFD